MHFNGTLPLDARCAYVLNLAYARCGLIRVSMAQVQWLGNVFETGSRIQRISVKELH